MEANNGLSAKTALVTGSTSGIGEATALLLARRGTRVLVTDSRDVSFSPAAEESNTLPNPLEMLSGHIVSSIAVQAVATG